MLPGSKIILPSSDVDDYTATALRSTITRILNPTSVKDASSKEIYKSENCPSWWPKDVLFSPVLVPKAVTNGITVVHRRKILAAFLEKCPDQYTISPPVDQQNSASTVETDQPEDPAVGTKRARMMSGSKIVLPSADAEEYSGNILRDTLSRIVNPKGLKGITFHRSENCPSWWPKDVTFCILSGPKAAANGITPGHQRKVLAAFLEKCPEQYTISPGIRLLNPTSSPLVGAKQPVREVSPQSSSESDQEEPVGMNQTPPTGANRTRSVGAATISTAAQHASPKLILPSLCANDYYQPALISLIQKILNPQRKKFTYSSANCPSWWPTDVPFIRAENMKAEDRRKILTAFLEKCPEQYTISSPDVRIIPRSNARSNARIVLSSKIVLPSSNVEEYSGIILRGTISRIVNPEGRGSGKLYTRENRPSWWPKDVAFSPATGPKAFANGITAEPLRKIFAAFLEKCPEQYTISPPVDQQNSAVAVRTDQPEDPAVRTTLLINSAVGAKKTRMMPGTRIVLPSSNVEEYSGNILQSVMSRIANSQGWRGRNVYTSDICPSWWPKDVAFAPMTGHKTIGIVTAVHRRKVLAAFLKKCPEQYTISPGAWLLNPTSSPLVGDKQPVREVGPQSSSESDQELVQYASPKLILPSSCANDYRQPALISLIRKILNPQRRHFIYSSANCPSWWPTDVPFIRTLDIKAKGRNKVLTAFLKKCPEQYTISPPVDQQNSASTVETDQPEDSLIYGDDSSNESDKENASIPSEIDQPEDSLIYGDDSLNESDEENASIPSETDQPEDSLIYGDDSSNKSDEENASIPSETDQPEDSLIYGDDSSNKSDEENASIPSDPEDLVNSLEQHLLDSRKRRLEAEMKVEELTKEVKRLREERKFIGSIVKRSRLHH